MTVEATIEMNSQPVTPEDQVRAELYSLIGNLLLAVPSQNTLDQLSRLQGEDTSARQSMPSPKSLNQ